MKSTAQYTLIFFLVILCACNGTPTPTTPTATIAPTPTTPVVDGVTGQILFADGPPPPERMNLALCVAHLDWPMPYCVLSSEAEWQFTVNGVFTFLVEPGDYGIAAYVPWLPGVVLLHWPGGDPIIFSVDGWVDLGVIEYSDNWCDLDPEGCN